MNATDSHTPESFEEYRKRMHPEMVEDETKRESPFNRKNILRTIFGIFMMFVYIGMGILFMINFFQWPATWTWVRWLVGVVLVLYGLFRAYRMVRFTDAQ